jgi:POT family proton-dependent oligopeptide transporter
MHQDESVARIQDFKGAYPKQLLLLCLTEMWERFCFYGMRGILTIFMVEKLLIGEKTANLQYGAIQAFIYAFAFIGGLFADKILGFRKSLFFGGILMVLGNFIIAFSPDTLFYIGICFTIVGTGFFKPNISSMVGTLYKEGDVRQDAGFALFYTAINVGAFLGGVIMVYLAHNVSWASAFFAAGVVMVIGLVTFIYTQRTVGTIGLSPQHPSVSPQKKTIYEVLVYIGSLLSIPLILLLVSNTQYTDYFMYTIGPVTLLYFFYEWSKYSWPEKKKLLAALIFILFSIVFWAFFEQSGGSLSIFALHNLHDKLLGMTIDPNMVNNSSNTIFVIIFSFLVGLVWVWMAKRKIEPNTIIKFGLGFLFLAASFYILFFTRTFADASGKTSLNVFTFAYLVMTFGELCLSPIGLSAMTKLSPKPLWGVMMGMWFLASAYGQYVAGLLGAGMVSPNENASLSEKLISYTDGYKQLGIYALICGVILILISPLLKKLMGEVK